MRKDNRELTAEIISSLHDELYKDFYRQKDFSISFGEYVAKQYELIYDGIIHTVTKSYE